MCVFRRKGTTKFADMQILSGKSDCDKDLNKNTGSVSPIKINKNQGGTLFLL
jgi:hypothetical protein